MAEVEPTVLTPTRIGSEQRRQHPTEQEEWAPICEEENDKPCIPEREYAAFCKQAKKYPNPRFKREDVRLLFSICDGQFAGTQLPRYYCAETAHKIRAHYFREWTIANNGVPPTLAGDVSEEISWKAISHSRHDSKDRRLSGTTPAVALLQQGCCDSGITANK